MYEVKPIEKQSEWDKAVLKFTNASFFSSWTWGEFERTLGKTFENYGIYKDDKLVALLPFTIVRAKRGKYLHLRHAPLMDWTDLDLVQECITFLREYATKEKLHFIRMSPMLLNDDASKKILTDFGMKPATAHSVDAELTLILDLTKSEDELLAEMRKNTRYSVRKAAKLGLTVVSTTGMENFDEFWKIFEESVKRNKWVAYSRKYVETEYKMFAEKGMARMFFCMYEGKAISASIFTYFNGQSVYHHSGSLTEFRNLPATYLLQWEAIKYAKEAGMLEHNLWGVSSLDDKNSPWAGLSLFKRGFGGFEREMIHAHDLNLHPWANIVSFYQILENKFGINKIAAKIFNR